ncbi:Mis12-Mtw1 protein family-domain-containing protein [Sparassis latifolia]
MLPTHSQPPTSKRKETDDGNPLSKATKRLKKEGSTKAGSGSKRKLNGEEQPGGLVIVRAPSARPRSAQGGETLQVESVPQSRASSRPPSAPPHQRSTGESSKPPAKKFRADGTASSTRVVSKSKDREVFTSNRAEPEVDEDVRLMQSETDTLRRRSQAAEQSAGSLNNNVQFLPSKSPRPPSNQRVHDTSLPLPQQETPRIERNRFMRGEEPNHRRKRSLSRGKRISSSYENTGVISHPHTSVSDTSFHKHIDGDLPEPQRVCQLLIWCTHRAMNELTDLSSCATSEQSSHASTSRREAKKPGKDPPPLSTDGIQLLKRVEEGVMKMLAEKKIDTNVYSSGGVSDARVTKPLKENEQNVKNRAREARFNAHNQRSRAEDLAWSKVQDNYNAYRSEILEEISKLESAKSKGKQRASADQLDEWEVNEYDLPPHFRGGENVGLARKIISAGSDGKSPLRSRLEELEYTMDRLHTIANSALHTTRMSEMDLDRRFALLNISLGARTQAAPSALPSSSTSLSSYLPPSLTRPSPTTDPQDLLRALSRVDAQRPQAQVGDAARRAVREVQRAHDATSGVAERRLTGVPPPTPRKPPGTPRRATTPGKGR